MWIPKEMALELKRERNQILKGFVCCHTQPLRILEAEVAMLGSPFWKVCWQLHGTQAEVNLESHVALRVLKSRTS